MRQLFVTCGLLAVMGICSSSASAQLNSGRGGTGGGLGASSQFGGGSAGGGYGPGGFGSSGFGTAGGFGSGGLAAGGMGSGGLGNAQGMGGGGLGGGGLGGAGQQGGFIGRNPDQPFLGGNNAQSQGQQGRQTGRNGMNNQFGNTNRGNRGGNMNLMNSMLGGGGGNLGGNNNNVPVIRPRQKIAFNYPAPKGELLQSNLQSQLTRASIRHPQLSNVMVTMAPEGEVVLRGAVSSESQARLAANLLRLEPGVRSVRNELTFPPDDTGSSN